MIHIKFITCIVAALLLTNCNSEPKKTIVAEKEPPDTIITNPKPAPKLSMGTSFKEIWEFLPTKTVPLIDTTNYDNIGENENFNYDQLNALQLVDIYPNILEYESGITAFPSYKIVNSDQYHTIIVIVHHGDHELKTHLLNYDLNENLIAHQMIAYDEIAEGWSRVFSEIDKEFISITDELYTEPPRFDNSKFQINRLGYLTEVVTQFSSNIRPNEALQLNQSYTDTIEFKMYEDNYDYWYMEGVKDEEYVSVNYNWDVFSNEKYDFKYGDILVLEWKMDSAWEAGDGETLYFIESAIDARKIGSRDVTSPVEFLWRGNKFDYETKDSINSIFINLAYSKTITDSEKAALGYVSTFIGNECYYPEWDENGNTNRTNLRCVILSALELGFQCSADHLGFLRQWFVNDSLALQELDNCSKTLDGATVQDTFDKISIVSDSARIIISYEVSGINMRESQTWSWSQTDTFEYDQNQIKLIDSDKSDVLREKLEFQEN